MHSNQYIRDTCSPLLIQYSKHVVRKGLENFELCRSYKFIAHNLGTKVRFLFFIIIKLVMI